MIILDEITTHTGSSVKLKLECGELIIDVYNANNEIMEGFYFNADDTAEITNKLQKELNLIKGK